ncbi:hypothetical protein SAMN05444336_102642 [Albimonas donghaensis]|uniref:Uncharacterized protein n=1 Tax=Albimonas donghaensis TaxID=356660 RepID=A0A1H2X7S0_9RHOB|nr:hypothetical protein [Albimonas donghaensis]SDW88962.1 hypothetical protein SAMN05444336_102642 [Albimonas donghaensis]
MVEPPQRGAHPDPGAAQAATERGALGPMRDDGLAASPLRDRAPVWPAALGGAALWLGVGAGLTWAVRFLPEGLRPATLTEAVTLAFCVTAPAALAIGWGALASRAAAAELRLDAVGRAASRAALGAGPGARAQAVAEGLSREDLTHAVAHAARDALDRERGAIARQLAELGETQRRIDLVIADTAERAGATVQAPVLPPAPHPEAPAPAGFAEPAATFAPPSSEPPPDPSPETTLEPEPTAEAEAAPEPAPEQAPAQALRQAAPIPASPPRAPETPDSQPSLPLSDPQETAPPTSIRDWSVMALALDFPRDERDEAGFAALEVATRDRPMAELLQAAEDALTILAQHGIYMEDLEIRHAPPALWLRFARGERGTEFASVGGVASEALVDTVRRMMKADPVFRDTAMHLMRRYDAVLRLAAAEPRGEGRLVDLADSRTGRAFMLVAQSVGTFD